MTLLKNKLLESNYIDKNEKFNIDTLKQLLTKKFDEIDFKDSKEDIMPFINDVKSLEIWNKEFFTDIIKNLQAKEI